MRSSHSRVYYLKSLSISPQFSLKKTLFLCGNISRVLKVVQKQEVVRRVSNFDST